jgi:hypothetical protein
MGRRFIVCAALAALASSPDVAFPCGVDNNSSSDSDSSSSSSDSDSDSDSGWDFSADDDDADSAPSCDDSSVIHGRAGCKQFGYYNASWRPRLQLAFGTSWHQISMASLDASATADHDQQIRYRVVGQELGRSALARAQTFDMRVSSAIGRHAYLGIQGSVGAVAAVDARPFDRGELTITPGTGFYGSVGALFGAGFTSSRWALRGEVEVGRRLVSLGVETRHGTCVDSSFIGESLWHVRPRVRAEMWLGPYVSLGAAVSSNTLRKGEVSAGAYMSFHLRGYDSSLTRR